LNIFYLYHLEEIFCDRPIFAKFCGWKKRDFVLTAYDSLRNFSAIRRLSPLPVTGLQILTYA
jgi:hypothetical protein